MNLSANIAKKYEKNKLKRIFLKKNFIFMKIKRIFAPRFTYYYLFYEEKVNIIHICLGVLR